MWSPNTSVKTPRARMLAATISYRIYSTRNMLCCRARIPGKKVLSRTQLAGSSELCGQDLPISGFLDNRAQICSPQINFAAATFPVPSLANTHGQLHIRQKPRRCGIRSSSFTESVRRHCLWTLVPSVERAAVGIHIFPEAEPWKSHPEIS